jgi:hypothetical protein
MRFGAVAGVLLIVAGLYVVLNGASFTRDKTVLKVGTLEANVKQQEPIPAWAGGAAILVGIGLVVVGLRKR